MIDDKTAAMIGAEETTTMIKHIKQLKREMENRIASNIAGELECFRLNTGLRVQALELDIVEITAMKSPRPEFAVSGVRAKVEF